MLYYQFLFGVCRGGIFLFPPEKPEMSQARGEELGHAGRAGLRNDQIIMATRH